MNVLGNNTYMIVLTILFRSLALSCFLIQGCDVVSYSQSVLLLRGFLQLLGILVSSLRFLFLLEICASFWLCASLDAKTTIIVLHLAYKLIHYEDIHTGFTKMIFIGH
jgi:apolipoprotein N-acyltransferase